MRTRSGMECLKLDSPLLYICDKHSNRPQMSDIAASGYRCESQTRLWASVPCRSGFRPCLRSLARQVYTVTVILTLVLATCVHRAEASSSYEEAARWMSEREGEMVKLLGQYGYLQDASRELGPAGLMSREAYVKAVRLLQRWGNLPQTGVIDTRTYELMKKPRCGNPDIEHNRGASLIRTRHKRYVTAPSKWEKNDLTFLIQNTTPDLSAARVHRAIIDAFKVWSDVCPLTFTQVFHEPADIKIQFAERYHEDGYPFDGQGSVLAHAFFPGDDRGGDTHFDDAETWTFNSTEGVDLFMVAAHEFGHALGLAHSSNTEALMYPWYQGYTDGFKLPYDDVQGIQSVYGSKDGGYIPPPPPTKNYDDDHRPDSNPRPRPPDSPDVSPCDHSIDAITVIRLETFVFIGDRFWRLSAGGARGEPTYISKFWYGLPDGGVDAVYERRDSKIIFFKGDRFWVFSGNDLMKNFPKEGRRITELGIDRKVEKIDAVFVWNYNQRTYLITGDMYWKLNENDDYIEFDYPRSMTIWSGVPTSVDSAFMYNNKNYFFKGDEYWEFYDAKMRTRKRTGTPIKKLFNCKDGKLQRDPGTYTQEGEPAKNQVSYKHTDIAASAPCNHVMIANIVILLTALYLLH